MIVEIALIHHVPGKLADVALRFEPGESLAGFVLAGFQIWAPRDQTGDAELGVTYPARTWSLPGGGQGTFVLLRDSRQDRTLDPPESVLLKNQIRAAYQAFVDRGAHLRAVSLARRTGQPIPLPSTAPRVAARGPLRARVVQPVGHIVHRVAPAHAQA